MQQLFARRRFDDDHLRLAQTVDFRRQDRRYVFGTGPFAQRLAFASAATGFIEDEPAVSDLCGLPVLRSTAIDINNDLVANGVVGGSPRSVNGRIRDLGGEPVDFLSFVLADSESLEFPLVGNGFAEEYRTNSETYQQILREMADDESRRLLTDIVCTRLYCDMRYMAAYSYRPSQQYFDPVIDLSDPNSVFADVGSYDGATSLEFRARSAGHRAIHIVEPNQNQESILKATFSGVDNVFLHFFAASDCEGHASFVSDGMASRVGIDGAEDVPIARLDDRLNPPPTYMKMDIEGGEVAALAGSQEIISRHRPRLAISVYHRADDIRRVYTFVKPIIGKSKCYLRHYTEGISETIMYFVPE